VGIKGVGIKDNVVLMRVCRRNWFISWRVPGKEEEGWQGESATGKEDEEDEEEEEEEEERD
jgi:hypothetical protein